MPSPLKLLSTQVNDNQNRGQDDISHRCSTGDKYQPDKKTYTNWWICYYFSISKSSNLLFYFVDHEQLPGLDRTSL